MTLQDARDSLINQLSAEISDGRTLDAIAAVPRERFVPSASRAAAYEDVALSIGFGQSISQPTIVAIMIEELELRRFDRVLEIGAGSGYQAAILGQLAREVIAVERIPELTASARATLQELGYGNIRVEQAGDALGWPDDAPYDAIIVAAAAPRLPRILLDQLAPGGRLIVPVGSRREQNLVKATKSPHGVVTRSLAACRFVPLIGQDAWRETEI